MASDRPSIPMLEAYLRQAEPPVTEWIPEWLDWALPIAAFLAIASFKGRDWLILPALGLGWLTYVLIHSLRRRLEARKPPELRLAMERYEKIERVAHLAHDRRLAKKVPEQVLLCLEQAARTWHDARESVQTLSVTEPAYVAEVRSMLDLSMGVAIAAADPVVLRDEQGKRDFARISEDSDLMARICMRIRQEDGAMRQWIGESSRFSDNSASALRQRMEMAQKERAAAEAELDGLSDVSLS